MGPMNPAEEHQCPECGEPESEHSKEQADECFEKWLLGNKLISDVIDRRLKGEDNGDV